MDEKTSTTSGKTRVTGSVPPAAPDSYDWPALVGDLNRLVRLRTTPVGMTLFATEAEMEAVPKIRRPKDKHTLDQIVAMAARMGWTVGATNADFVTPQCGAVIGLYPRDEEFLSGRQFSGVWFETISDSSAHQHAMDTVPFGRYDAVALSPLASGRLDPPDVALLYATPGQMILMINGLQWSGYRKLEWGCVGESSCADSWGRALATREPSVSIPCFAERRFGGVQDDELLMATPPEYLPKMIAGLEALARNGLRYPVPPYGIQQDARAGMSASYG